MIDPEFVSLSKEDCEKAFSVKKKEILELVWETYGQYGADDLENLTHAEDPWKNTRGSLGVFEKSNAVISNQAMKDYYINYYHE